MTTPSQRLSSDNSIEKVARLVEESTLGTVGARQLRDRAGGAAIAIRARACFISSPAGRAWWQENQHNPDALRTKAREFAAAGDSEISVVLARLADDRQACAGDSATGTAVRPPTVVVSADVPGDLAGFQAFHDRQRPALAAILSQEAGLPRSLGHKLIRRAMAEAFDDWEQLAAAGNPEEWVLGRALQLYRDHRRLPREAEADDPVLATADGGPQARCLPGASAQQTNARVVGALAVAASRVEVLRDASPAAFRHPRRQAVLRAGDSAVAMTIPVRGDSADPADWDADRAVTALYSTHYRSLVRLAALLVRDVATAEEVVQDSFVAMHSGWRRLRDSDKALSYLRQSVVNRSRSVLRQRTAIERTIPKPPPGAPTAEHGAIVLLERSAIVAALRSLPPRQREALVLRYYGDMSESQVASVMGISLGAVKSHTRRAMSALRSILEAET